MGRILAMCGWLAMQARRPFRGPLRPLRAWAPLVVAGVLLVVAVLPFVVPMFDAQPQDATVEQIAGGEVTEPSGWVRLQAHVIMPLRASPTGEPGHYGILVDETDTLQAIVVRSDRPIRSITEPTMATGHRTGATVEVFEDLPIEATVFGAPPDIVPNLIVDLDTAATPERSTLWPLAIPPLLLAIALIVGSLAGYPVFRPTSEVDVLSTPLAPGDRVPAAFGGRLGSIERDLAVPGSALLVMRPGPNGNQLTAQPLPEDGRPAPPPVPIVSERSRGVIGWVFTMSEAVPALALRTEGIDATLLFAKTGERDRIAALVGVHRG